MPVVVTVVDYEHGIECAPRNAFLTNAPLSLGQHQRQARQHSEEVAVGVSHWVRIHGWGGQRHVAAATRF
jgi:hypothetical protein